MPDWKSLATEYADSDTVLIGGAECGGMEDERSELCKRYVPPPQSHPTQTHGRCYIRNALDPHSVVMRAPPRRFGIRSTPAFMTFLPPDADGEVHRGERDIYSWREVGASPEPTAKLILYSRIPTALTVRKPTPLDVHVASGGQVEARVARVQPRGHVQVQSRAGGAARGARYRRDIAEMHPR